MNGYLLALVIGVPAGITLGLLDGMDNRPLAIGLGLAGLVAGLLALAKWGK